MSDQPPLIASAAGGDAKLQSSVFKGNMCVFMGSEGHSGPLDLVAGLRSLNLRLI